MRRLLLLIMLLATYLSTTAQQEQRAFYVYRNDGCFNAFFFEEVDSMVISRIDPDSVLCQDYVVQEVWTRDTVVRIPLASIDSISYQTPENVYKIGVIEFDRELLEYLSSTDSLRLYFASTLPDALIPCVGAKLATATTNNLLPYGLSARVTDVIRNTDGSITVDYEHISPTECFDRLFSVVSVACNSKMQARSNKRDEHHFSVPPIDFNINMGDIALQKWQKRDNDVDFGIAVGVRGNINLHIEPRVDVIQIIQYGDKFTDFKITATNTLTTDFDINAKLNIDWRKNLAEGVREPIPYVPFLELYVEAGPFVSFTADIAYSAETSEVYQTVYRQTFSTNENVKDLCSFKKYNISSFESCRAFSGTMELSAGFYANEGVRLLELSEKQPLKAKLYVGQEIGAKMTLNMPFSKQLKDILGDANTRFYNLVKDQSTLDCKVYLKYSIGGEIQVFHWRPGSEVSVTLELATLFTKPLFPSFYRTAFYPHVTDNGATMSCNISDDILLPVKVGFKIFDSDDNELYRGYYEESIYENSGSFSQFSVPLKDNLPLANRKCRLYPFFSLFNTDITASPECNIEIDVSPVTDEALDVQSRTAKLLGHLEGAVNFMGESSVGFFIGNTSTPMNDGRKLSATLLNDNTFTVEAVSLSAGERYYYCAYLLEGNTYKYGKVIPFDTPEPPDNAVDLGLSVLWAKWNVGANSEAEPGGLYGWADPSGTNTTYNVMNESGTAWISSLYGGNNPSTSICGTSLDIATMKWGGDWRLPTEAEMTELIDECSWEWTTNEGTSGMTVTGPNGNSIFLPAGGDRFGTEQREYGMYGYYWTGTLNTEEKRNAYRLEFDDWGASCTSYARYIGHLVRPVMNKPQ